MGLFRRRPRHLRTGTDVSSTDVEATELPSRTALVPLASEHRVDRCERALVALAAQSGQLHHDAERLRTDVDNLSTRLDALARLVTDNMAQAVAELPSAATDATKVAAELARLEINLAARLDAVRDEVAALAGQAPEPLDPSELTPADSGWTR